jgi:hypothetical protein
MLVQWNQCLDWRQVCQVSVLVGSFKEKVRRVFGERRERKGEFRDSCVQRGKAVVLNSIN